MGVHARTWFTAKQRAELWERWKSGQCVADIARALERRNKSGVYRVLALNGGIAPLPRRRAQRALRLAEREEISRGIAAGRSMRRIAQDLGRSPSTVSREIRRNGGCRVYRASWADRRAWERSLRPKPCRLACHAELRWSVAQKLALQWSPEQIAGWLKYEFPADQTMRVSHETIYLTFVHPGAGGVEGGARGAPADASASEPSGQRQQSAREPRTGPDHRRDLHSRAPGRGRGPGDPGSLGGRPDLRGAADTYLATLVERHSRFVDADPRRGQGQGDLGHQRPELSMCSWLASSSCAASLTWDRGTEMAEHARFTLATDVKVYFCDPQSPWQRGSNENTNGLLRQYFPKRNRSLAFLSGLPEQNRSAPQPTPTADLGIRNPSR